MKRRWIILAAPLLLAGCGGAPPPKPAATLDLTVIGSATQNPDASGTAEPVAVRIYPLTATGKFMTADPYSLMDNAASLLGADLAGPSDQVIVAPGATVGVKRRLPPGAQSLGIVVLFRAIDRAQWRLVAKLAPHGPNPLILRIDGIAAKLTPSVKKG
ncbi:type VI secretion system lipoprotein TssJ [Acidiphilium sp. AL]|uniref:Type VI secretion system lipoprotein TssJ n=1 Tax=Acidiphilium iwatense TaxID=768198 RepID=A0ABS9E0F5_9PROT|nr:MULTISPECIES: type VI secretion system lipoprotein TssJ [Acidiphilium]MCF3948497.1 type VI secretion system lipoprotein TssJ [Acidiphilium iwatense]MCU4161236.1 type VI secretion system lipoprotein TssJ [Acidiphilium sp. AL]